MADHLLAHCTLLAFFSLKVLSLTLYHPIQGSGTDQAAMVKVENGSDISFEEDFSACIKVLIIDDDRVSLQVVCTMLERCGYNATKCTSGTKALEMLRENEGEFDIVLTDVHMPDMDGFQLLELVGLEMGIPVVMLSEDARHETMVKGLKHGACDYLVKPVQMEELERIKHHVLTWRRANAGINSDSSDD